MNRIQKLRIQLSRQYERYRVTFGPDSAKGQEVLSDLIKFTGYEDDAFVPGSPEETAYNLGQQRVVRRILKMTLATPKDIDRIAKLIHAQEPQDLWDDEEL